MQNCPPSYIYPKENENSMFLQIFFKFLKKASAQVRGTKPSALLDGLCRQFSLAELKAATNNFDDDMKIGEGAFCRVYKGLIDGGSLVVAVKRLRVSSRQGLEEFRTEVQLLCQLRHQNLASLIGFCYEKDEGILLVYEHMTHGSLFRHLFENADPLPWKRRLEICIGVARGLHYLHTGAKYAIIHRDVKPSNILLDENWDAKLGDFGLSRIGPSSISKPKPKDLKKTIIAAGTLGYLAPEYVMQGELSEKCDVYSLGVVLLEVFCGRKTYDSEAVEVHLITGVSKCIKNGCIHDMIDPFLKGKIAPVCLIEFVEIAVSCIYENPNERPSMGEVEVTLELALELQEKADLVMKADNPHAGYAYEDVSFRVSVEQIWEARPYVLDEDLTESVSVSGSVSEEELEIGG